MPNNEQVRPGGQRRPEAEQTAAEPTGQERRAALDADVDAILDEIDEVLEENAEEFVKGFVQKGGE
jgi:ubiquitin-like protein Pup